MPNHLPPKRPLSKPGLHPRNRHRGRYDFAALVAACPRLAPLVHPNPLGEPTIDFADPKAVRLLNEALLASGYGVQGWTLPEAYLCPPIPGRADYLHYAADLLGQKARNSAVRVLDIGVGANGIYPLLGHQEYGWSFVGTDVDPKALAHLAGILKLNPPLAQAIELRLQRDPGRIFEGVTQPGETFDLCLCNPPFHASPAEAREGTQRKWRNLGRGAQGGRTPTLNFGGQGAELWCPGGEGAFVTRMVEESAHLPRCCRWFTSLLSKATSLPKVQAALRKASPAEVRILPMSQGQKQSRIIAWTFLRQEQPSITSHPGA